jgi:hypothetical protein
MKFKHIHQSGWLSEHLNKGFANYNNCFAPSSPAVERPDLSISEEIIKDGVFLEVGVGNIIDHDFYLNSDIYKDKIWSDLPIIGSNTIELLQHGWRGYYFDPVPEFVKQAYLLAPNKDKVYTKAVGLGEKNEKKTLLKGESCFFCGLSESSPAPWGSGFGLDGVAAPWIQKEYDIQNANEALLESGMPNVIDFFSLDVEGYEINVLKNIDFDSFKFKLIFVEVDRTQTQCVSDLLLPQGYLLIATDGGNALYAHRKFTSS